MFKKRVKMADISGNSSDATLVMASLGGDRDAFCEIVTRYQSLLCSIAYSSVGDLKHSEDIAQEAFVEAWKKLDTLHDPVKLKSWLCGILRFKVSHFRRKEAKQPVKDANELSEATSGVSADEELENRAIREQEQALLWQALEKMPENYREPLILFYREQRSVEHVADELELSEDAVKQRLSRGRKLLQEAMITFVEDTLEKSKPGAAFTMAVLAAISGASSPPVKAAALGVGVAKAGSSFKWTSLITILAPFSGLVSSFFGLRTGLDQSRTPRERRSTIKFVALFMLIAIVYVAGMFAFKHLAVNNEQSATLYAIFSQCLVFGFSASYIILVIRMFKDMRQLRAQERLFNPEAFESEAHQVGSKQREYRSRFCLAGIPLLHFRFGMPEQGDKPVVGWIAGGEHAFGLLFAWGGIAIAPISVGIISVGVISIGAIGLGLIGLGTVAIGVVGFGASAIAYKGYASLSALGWESAYSGGFSIAKEAALGPISFAKHINNEQAAEIANLVLFAQSYLWALGFISILVIVPAALYSNKVRQRMGKN
ncbi:RNA polymerase sigma factor [Pleionea sp. CnH1-48]|uniref:RNA polymerase sigma factor n=1 Tax=Pleionea sp. CnH1-48 TaxID=2954494 RepID=UPI002098264A|nr:sigma-70 family RNA polymerase sigma factor [Pleionea sp. CnH1-48]MCO7223276.1 sigma-70 family RNA polymerase sigma factor [Pleionea sp. CnH1-48]